MWGYPVIFVQDLNGANVLCYLKLGEDKYFGGMVNDRCRELEYGPHVWKTIESMFATVAKLVTSAADDKNHFTIIREHHSVIVTREMNAAELADVLCCDVQTVRDYFGLLVKVT